MSKPNSRVIIRRIKDDPTKEHHGGMWKVAYADFITALMALFMLLWVLNSTPKKNLKGVANYFNKVNLKNSGIGIDEKVENKGIKGILSEEQFGGVFSEADKRNFVNLISSIKNNSNIKNFDSNLIIDSTEEGLRIQIVDSEDRPMFKPNTSQIHLYMINILTEIGKLIAPLPNKVSIIGYTASIKNGNQEQVNLWNLSVERALKVKEFLGDILQDKQFSSITGKADTENIDTVNPYSSKNIRISLLILKREESNNNKN
jgi:chemotaxis protein MotB